MLFLVCGIHVAVPGQGHEVEVLDVLSGVLLRSSPDKNTVLKNLRINFMLILFKAVFTLELEHYVRYKNKL